MQDIVDFVKIADLTIIVPMLPALQYCMFAYDQIMLLHLSGIRILASYVHCAYYTVLLTKTAAAQNEDALGYHKVRELYFLAAVFVSSIYQIK